MCLYIFSEYTLLPEVYHVSRSLVFVLFSEIYDKNDAAQ